MFRILVPVVDGDQRGYLPMSGAISEKGIEYICKNPEREIKRILMGMNGHIMASEDLSDAVLFDADLGDVTARPMGAIRAVGGIAEATIGAAGIVAPEPATTIGGVVVFAHGADQTSTGLRQIWTGRRERSLTSTSVASGLTMFQVDSRVAGRAGENFDMAMSLFSGGYSIGLARTMMANPLNQIAVSRPAAQLGRDGPEWLPINAPNRLATSADEAVFWSGIGRGGDKKALAWINNNGGATLESTLASRGVKLPAWNASDPSVVAAWQKASVDFANGAKGHVRVLQGDTLRVDAIFGAEFRALQANPSVKSVISINPETGAEMLLWSR